MKVRLITILSLCALSVGCPNNQAQDPNPAAPIEEEENENEEAEGVQDAGAGSLQELDSGTTRPPLEEEPLDAGSLPAEWFECQGDRDCVLYEEGCCDHCNGGTLWSVNTSFLDALKEAHPDPTDAECEGVMCTRRMCFEMEAICEEGMCASRQKLQNVDEPDAGVAGNVNDAGNSDAPIVSIDAGQDNGANDVQDGGTTPPQELPQADAGVSGEGAQAVWFECGLDSECVLHEYGCCDYCSCVVVVVVVVALLWLLSLLL